MNQLYDWPTTHPPDVQWQGPDPASQYTTNYFDPKLRKLDPADPSAKAPFSEEIREFVRTANLDSWGSMSQEVDVEPERGA